VIEAYWALVFSRTDLWAREQQVAQLAFANERAKAELEAGISSLGVVAQTQVAYENFRANLIAAQAAVLQREAAFRNILGLPPYEPERLIPVSPLVDDKLEIDWERIVGLAEVQRPDIIELKLILEADQQRLLLSRNQALPRLDGVALYRWNGVEGELPGGGTIASRPGQFTDWNLGVNFSVPLGLRAGRAGLRQQELIIRRDQANLEQGLHQVIHLLAGNLRNLEQFYEQYKRFQDVRKAAKLNLDQQLATEGVGNVQFIVVLQAIVDWGNSVSNEAQALIQYNTELARLERETGTILEAHGIAFYEERFGSIGPLGRLATPQCYPFATPPTDSTIDPYGATDEPSEEFFDLTVPQTTGRLGDDIEMNIPQPDRSPELLDSVPPPDPKGGVKQDDQSSSPGFGRKLLDGPVRAATAIRGLFKK
jgi:outer membrane protein TolC